MTCAFLLLSDDRYVAVLGIQNRSVTEALQLVQCSYMD